MKNIMNTEDYLFHTINKDCNDINSIYDNFEKILLCGCLQSNKKRNNDIIKETNNGSDYICLLKYIPLDDCKVYKMNEDEFNNSSFKNVYKSYSDYLNTLKLPPLKMKPL